MDDIILRVKDICKYYPGVKALDGVNFEVKRGEVHAICGENGAGKSTFIKILTGANEPTSGTIEFNGKEYAKLNLKGYEYENKIQNLFRYTCDLHNRNLFYGLRHEAVRASYRASACAHRKAV